MKKKLIIILSIVMLTMILVSGCYDTTTGVIIDNDWNVKTGISFSSPDGFGKNKPILKDIVNRYKFFYPSVANKVETKITDKAVYIKTKPTPIEKVTFIKRQQIGKDLYKIIINLPKLVTYQNSNGKYQGRYLKLSLLVPYKVVEANTTRYKQIKPNTWAIDWFLEGSQLGKPVKLWAKVKINE